MIMVNDHEDTEWEELAHFIFRGTRPIYIHVQDLLSAFHCQVERYWRCLCLGEVSHGDTTPRQLICSTLTSSGHMLTLFLAYPNDAAGLVDEQWQPEMLFAGKFSLDDINRALAIGLYAATRSLNSRLNTTLYSLSTNPTLSNAQDHTKETRMSVDGDTEAQHEERPYYYDDFARVAAPELPSELAGKLYSSRYSPHGIEAIRNQRWPVRSGTAVSVWS